MREGFAVILWAAVILLSVHVLVAIYYFFEAVVAAFALL